MDMQRLLIWGWYKMISKKKLGEEPVIRRRIQVILLIKVLSKVNWELF